MENLTHGIVSTEVHKGNESSCDSEAGDGSSAAEVTRAFQLNPNLLHRWRKEFRHGPAMRFLGWGSGTWMRPKWLIWSVRSDDRRWRSIFEGVLAETRRAADAAGTDWKTAIYRHMQSQAKRAMKRQCCERAIWDMWPGGFFRCDSKAETPEDDLDLQGDIQKIAMEYPYYGCPRITAGLKRRGGK